MEEYLSGIDHQFEDFLLNTIQDTGLKPFREFIKLLENFWVECKNVRKSGSKWSQNEHIIDSCNYLLQTHFRLVTSFRLYKQRDQNQSIQLVDNKILGFVYNVLTDSLALVTSFAIEENSSSGGRDENDAAGSGAAEIKRSKWWSERFVASFKELKRFMRQSSKLTNSKSVSCDSLAALDLNPQ